MNRRGLIFDVREMEMMQMNNIQASSNLEDRWRHPPRYPNRGRIWDEVEVREQLDKKMTDPSILGFTSVRSLLEK